jgi:guanosine-3',5'-bis(diphosphate) 3'-pyrophosphohydrolase
MNPGFELIAAASAFAARKHQHALRKDGKTPYVSHVFRVCLVVRHVFGFDDPRMLAAALLHDTIEDTTTDYDDLVDEFGEDVARWVAALTKDMRLPDEQRENEYELTLADADWPVKACKLADIYDNLTDSGQLSAEKRRQTVGRSRRYLNAIRVKLPASLAEAVRLAEQKLAMVEAGLSSL